MIKTPSTSTWKTWGSDTGYGTITADAGLIPFIIFDNWPDTVNSIIVFDSDQLMSLVSPAQTWLNNRYYEVTPLVFLELYFTLVNSAVFTLLARLRTEIQDMRGTIAASNQKIELYPNLTSTIVDNYQALSHCKCVWTREKHASLGLSLHSGYLTPPTSTTT